MTTRHSPEWRLRQQASRMTTALKAMKPTDHGGRPVIKVGIVMDDKTIVLEITRKKVMETPAHVLVEYLLGLMQEQTANN